MSTAAHTPTPWEACCWDIRDVPSINDRGGMSGGLMIATTRDSGHHVDQTANAAHIVRCVNVHDDLVAALRFCVDALQASETCLRSWNQRGGPLNSEKAIFDARAALAKAGAA